MVSPQINVFPQLQINSGDQYGTQEAKAEAPVVKQEMQTNILQPNFGFNQMQAMQQNMFLQKPQFYQNQIMPMSTGVNKENISVVPANIQQPVIMPQATKPSAIDAFSFVSSFSNQKINFQGFDMSGFTPN